MSKVNAVDLVGLLVVASDNRAACQILLDCFLSVLISLLCLLPDFLHVLEAGVGSYYFKADVDIKQSTLFFHDKARVKTRPNLNIVCVKRVCTSLVEALLSYSLELE